MPFIKKIREDWVTNPNHAIGEVVFVTNAEKLVAEGKAVYVDDLGNEISRGEPTKCPICVFVTIDAYELADHIYKAHPRTAPHVSAITSVEEKKPEQKKFRDMTPEEQKAWRMENLRKAREASKAKKEAELTSQVLKDAIKAKNEAKS